ncbi:hypothetical protein HAX54_026712 [Datura stramonium]|uniref:GST C-terminal domain-containing protein n=1 Tax=Datura stramonium TaxID=4076 RepID=A0ABS8V2P5_DATST|nr:hypothetical protein [Datura stramonium]
MAQVKLLCWWPPSILPQRPYERAIARFWAKFDGKCLEAVGKALYKFGEEEEKSKQEAYEMLKIVDNELKDKKFFGGDKIGFVDVAANYIPFWFEIVEEATGVVLVTSENSLLNFYAWRDEYLNCSEVKEIFLIGTQCLVFSKLNRFWANFFTEKGTAVGEKFLLKGEEQEKVKEELYEMLKVLDNKFKDKQFFLWLTNFGFTDIVAKCCGTLAGSSEEASGVVVTRENFQIFVLGEMNTSTATKTSRNIYLQDMN